MGQFNIQKMVLRSARANVITYTQHKIGACINGSQTHNDNIERERALVARER